MSKNLGINIKADSKQAEKGINKITSEVNKLKKNIDSFAKAGSAISGLSSALNLATKAFSAITNAINECTEAAKRQERAERSLELAVKNNPLMLNSSSVRLKEFASSLQSISDVGDEELLPFMAELVRNGRSEAEIMDIMQTAVDMQASGVMSLDSAVKALNATYNGTAGTLGRQNSAIKGLTAEQLKNGKAVEILKGQYAGLAEANADAAKQFANTWGDVKEILGGVFSGLKNVLAGIGNAVLSPVTAVYSTIKGWAEQSQATKEQLEEIDRIVKGEQPASAAQMKTNEDALKDYKEQYKQTVEVIRKSLEQLNAVGVRGIDDWDEFVNVMGELQHELSLNNVELPWLATPGNWVTDPKKVKEACDAIYGLQEKLDSDLEKLNEARIHQEEVEENERANAYLEEYETEKKKIEQKIENDKIASKNITEEQKKQEVFNKLQEWYVKKLNEGAGQHKVITEELHKMASEIQNVENASLSDIQKAEQAYDQAIEKMNKEREARKSLGEVLSDEQEKREELTVKTSAYMKLVESGGAETSTAKKALKDIEALQKEVSEYDRLSETLGSVKKDTQSYIDAHNQVKDLKLSDTIAKTIEALEIEAASLGSDSKALEEYLKKIRELKELEGQVKGLESDDRVTQFKNEYGARNEALEALAKLEADYAALTAEEKLEVEDEYALKHRQLMAAVVESDIAMVANFIDNYAQSMSQISQMVQQNAENDATIKQAALEKQYAAGEVTEEEYYAKQEEIEKEAAKKKYQIQMWEWTAQVAQTTAQVAQSIANALAQGGPYLGPALAAMMGAMGGVQLAAVIASKPIPPSFATGGIVGGNSYYGDKVSANVNSGEMILNRRQQANLFDMIGAGKGGSVQNNINVENRASGFTSVDVQEDRSGIRLIINETVKTSLESGTYRKSMQQNNLLMDGTAYSS